MYYDYKQFVEKFYENHLTIKDYIIYTILEMNFLCSSYSKHR